MKKILTITFIIFVINLIPQNKEYLVLFSSEKTGTELFGYKTVSGKVVIEAKYTQAFPDTLFNVAFVLINNGWLCINKKEKLLFKPFIYDNGPDYYSEGLIRVVKNNKIGFANPDGKIVIKPQFDFVTPFEDGKAEYTLGGKKSFEANGEHWMWKGGYEKGIINKKGIKIKKSKISGSKSGKNDELKEK